MKEELFLRMYRFMLLIRLLDERMIALQRQGRIGFYGAATGEEGCVIGSAAALQPEDWVFPALRQGGVLLYRGLPLKDYVAQVFGNAADVNKGHQMPCHYSHAKYHHVSWSSCIATQLPQAVGAAHAMKIMKHKSVVLAYLGDGATSEADFHVALNFAGVFKVPVVFFCQNNQWAISIPVQRQTASSSIAVKAGAYGIEGVGVDGNDILACYEVASNAVAKAREGRGATLIEAVTFRMGAHSTSDDPRLYRNESEVEAWKKRDPILGFRKHLEQKKLWDKDKEESLISGLTQEITEAIDAVEKEPPPRLETLFEDVYAGLPQHLRDQWAELQRG